MSRPGTNNLIQPGVLVKHIDTGVLGLVMGRNNYAQITVNWIGKGGDIIAQWLESSRRMRNWNNFIDQDWKNHLLSKYKPELKELELE